MPLSPTPNMGLSKPEPSVTTGPQWAQMLNDLIDLIDAHDHTSGRGEQIQASALNINADLDFQNNDATSLRSTRYQLGTSVLSASDDKGCVYVKDGNLYFNNSAGAAVQVTSGTSVVSAITGAFTATTPGGYPYTVSAGDAQRVLLVNTTAARTINLPLATTALLFAIKDVSGQASTNNISVVPNGTNTIDGVNATRLLRDNYSWTFLISDGVSNWSIAKMTDVVTALQALALTVTGATTTATLTASGAIQGATITSTGATQADSLNVTNGTVTASLTASGAVQGGSLNVTGASTIASLVATGTSSGTRVVTAKAAASQTANIFEAQNSAGTKLMAVGPNGMINLGPSPTLTIASGAITVTKSYHKVDTEGAAATDDLDTINGGTDGDILILRTANASRDVTVKNGTGNLRTVGDFVLNFMEDRITLQYDGDMGVWLEIARSNNV